MMVQSFDIEALLIHVFAPQPAERVLVMADLPHAECGDDQEWEERREMAAEWHCAFERLGTRLGFGMHPLLTYPATGAPNAPLPSNGEVGGKLVRFEEILSHTNIVLAMTKYSATAPLIKFTQELPSLRAASMPGVVKAMEQTALSADYGEVARKSHLLAAALDLAVGATAEFSTGHQVYFDLRHRRAHADDGQLHADKKGIRLINLPSGEAYSTPYEGELEGKPSRTGGTIPVMYDSELVLLTVEQNRIVEVIGEGPEAARKREYFSVDRARRNIAELGLGCNDKAVISGRTLEDEKVLGMHWAYGRSEHLGGTVGVSDFEDPSNVVHQDVIYAEGSAIGIASLILEYKDGNRQQIIKDSQYTIF
jgi:hypothetical protein